MDADLLNDAELLKAPAPPDGTVSAVAGTVTEILDAVRLEGLPAVRRYSERFDRWSPGAFRVTSEQLAAARAEVDAELVEHIRFAHHQVTSFARLQRDCILPLEAEVLPGVTLGHRVIPVDSVGCYVPGGRYPLIASALMSIATARTAGVSRVVACAPPRDADGIDPVQLFTMELAGADEIYCVGGVQALAAFAYGVEGFGAPVDMLVGPGNAYVAEAKRQLFGTVGIDLLAGPTEMLVIADESASAPLVALDLLGQAEHGGNSPVVLLSTSRELAVAVAAEIERQLPGLPTQEVARAAWDALGTIAVVADREAAAATADAIASEHVEIHTRDPAWFAEVLRNYGTICVGPEATIAYSDKAVGTNHTLPTGGAARYTSGLWVGSFLKTPTFQRLTHEGSQRVAPAAAAIATAEGMLAHALTATTRLDPVELGHA